MSLTLYRILRTILPLTVLQPPLAGAATFMLDPKATYLSTSSDPLALDAVPIDLAALPFTVAAGDSLQMRRLGSWENGAGGTNFRLIAVFSSSATLLPASLSQRLPGAIAAGTAFVTNPSFAGNVPTDMPEDFAVSTSDGTMSTVDVIIPENARYLFFSTGGSFYSDDTDTNGTFGVSILPVPEPSASLLGAAALVGAAMRRRLIKP